MKIVKHLFVLGLLCISLAFTCEKHIFSYEEGCLGKDYHSDIHFVNNSESDIWLEWNPMLLSDSLFSGIHVCVKDSMGLKPLNSMCWEGELRTIPFVRVLLFDAPYNSKNCHPDSLRKFQDKHLLYMHWYTEWELDSLGWEIHYPPVE